MHKIAGAASLRAFLPTAIDGSRFCHVYGHSVAALHPASTALRTKHRCASCMMLSYTNLQN